METNMIFVMPLFWLTICRSSDRSRRPSYLSELSAMSCLERATCRSSNDWLVWLAAALKSDGFFKHLVPLRILEQTLVSIYLVCSFWRWQHVWIHGKMEVYSLNASGDGKSVKVFTSVQAWKYLDLDPRNTTKKKITLLLNMKWCKTTTVGNKLGSV